MAPCNGTQQWHHVHSPKVGRHQWHPTVAHYNGTQQWHHVHSPKVGRQPSPPPTLLFQHRPQIAKTNFCVIKGTTSTPLKLVVTPSHHSTLQRHPSMAPPPPQPEHTVMAPCNGTTSTPLMAPRPLPQSWSSPSPPTIAHYNRTLQWHHVHSTKVGRHPPTIAPSAMAPRLLNHPTIQVAPSNGTTSTAPCNGTQQWHHVHSTITHYNGTLQRHPLLAPHPLNHSTLQWHPAMAPSNGTTSTAPRNGTLVPRPISQSGSSPSPLLEVRTPIAIAIWGKIIDPPHPFHIQQTNLPLLHQVKNKVKP